MKYNLLSCIIVIMLAVALLPSVLASASFQVTNLACTDEVKVNNPFSCDATIRNTGDSAGTVGTVQLISDGNSWFSTSTVTVNSNVGAGESTTVSFSNVNPSKSGYYGFNSVRIDDVSDTSSPVTSERVNVINVAVSVTNSRSSAAMGVTWTSDASVTAGGNVDVTLTFAVESGGCSIGNQASSTTFSDLTEGGTGSKTWTVTMGTSGNCKFTISASATGNDGVASTTDSTQSTISCTDCPTDSGSSSSSSSGGGGGGSGGGGGILAAALGELNEATTYDLGRDEKISFLWGGENHSVHILNFTEISADIEVRSTPQQFTLTIGQEKRVDFDNNRVDDISVTLKSINIITKKVRLMLVPLSKPGTAPKSQTPEQAVPSDVEQETSESEQWYATPVGIGLGVVVLIIIIVLVVFFASHRLYRHSEHHKARMLAKRIGWREN